MCEHLIRKLQFLATAEDATGMNDSAIAMREAAAELERLRKDAERYRWLRDGNDNKKSAACHIAVNCYGLEWHDAIDAAIAQGKGE